VGLDPEITNRPIARLPRLETGHHIEILAVALFRCSAFAIERRGAGRRLMTWAPDFRIIVANQTTGIATQLADEEL
jgi:hypothetical protein